MPATEPPRNPDVAVEPSDAPARLFAFLATGLVAFIVISVVALQLIYPSALSGQSDAPRTGTAKPRLQIDQAADLATHRAAERKALTTYAWVDHRRGTLRIPVDQAMHDVVAAGIKDWPENAK